MSKPRKRAKSAAARGERSEASDSARAATPARLEDRPRTELFEMAHRLEIAGYAEMTKVELVEAIRRR